MKNSQSNNESFCFRRLILFNSGFGFCILRVENLRNNMAELYITQNPSSLISWHSGKRNANSFVDTNDKEEPMTWKETTVSHTLRS